MNEHDKKLAHALIWERPSDNWKDMENRVVAALTSVRRNAATQMREACVKVVKVWANTHKARFCGPCN